MAQSHTHSTQSDPLSANQQASNAPTRRSQTRLLRIKFLVPLAVAIFAIILVLTTSLYQRESKALRQGLVRIQASASDFYEDSVKYDARALRAVMDTLKRDAKLSDIFASYDRSKLLEHTATLFEDLKRDFAITHFYFSKPDRVNFLRVHTPERYGDKIDRITTIQAEQKKTIAYGVELGPLGTFTLRLVSPWYDKQTGQLIGYVELGMEIDRVLQKLRDFFDVDVVVAVHKKNLKQRQWELGMQALGRLPEWDRFDNVTLSVQSPQGIPPVIAEYYADRNYGRANEVLELMRGGLSYRLISIPLQDASGRQVAEMALLSDVSVELDMVQRTVLLGSIAAFVGGGLLVIFFYRQVGRIGLRIDRDKHELERLANRDGLTGLYNRRMFQAHLDDELSRAARHNRSVSLLMIDIDHFKQVNDNYGHQAGDAILQELSNRLMREVRDFDHVCRYGGEELAIILPETDVQEASQIAERVRNVVATLPFDTGNGQLIPIMVSIGVASYPIQADTDTTLVSAADNALYAAKKGGRNRVFIAGQDDKGADVT